MGRRGSKKGVKRGPYKKHKPDQLGLLKKLATTNPRQYSRLVMRKKRGSTRLKAGRPPKRFLVKDFEQFKKAKQLKVKE